MYNGGKNKPKRKLLEAASRVFFLNAITVNLHLDAQKQTLIG